jgi:hypothetical protein
MAERHKSKDGRRETEEVLGDKSEISQQGRAGGRLAKEVGTQDEIKQTEKNPAGKTRVTDDLKKEDNDDGS